MVAGRTGGNEDNSREAIYCEAGRASSASDASDMRDRGTRPGFRFGRIG